MELIYVVTDKREILEGFKSVREAKLYATKNKHRVVKTRDAMIGHKSDKAYYKVGKKWIQK